MTRIVAALALLATVITSSPTTSAGSCGVRRINSVAVVNELVTTVVTPVLLPAAVFQYLPALQPVLPVQAVPGGQYEATQPQLGQDIDRIIRERVDAILREKFGTVDDGPPALVGGSQGLTGQALQDAALSLLANNCMSCHTQGTKTAGNVTIFTKSGEELFFQPNRSKSALFAEISSGRMPKGKKAITNGDLEVLRQWLLGS